MARLSDGVARKYKLCPPIKTVRLTHDDLEILGYLRQPNGDRLAVTRRASGIYTVIVRYTSRCEPYIIVMAENDEKRVRVYLN